MTAIPDSQAGDDTQKAKLLMLFSALGLIVFLLDLAAGVWLWRYTSEYRVEVPSFDRFIGELRQSNPAETADLATQLHESWATCEATRTGTQETVVHIVIAASFLGLVLFSLCFLLALWLYRRLAARPGGIAEALPPDPVDDTWK